MPQSINFYALAKVDFIQILIDNRKIISIFRNMSKYRKTLEDFLPAFKALSNRNRLRIFTQLLDCCSPAEKEQKKDNGLNQISVGDVCCGVPLANSTVSHHLKELQRAGLIKMDRDGQFIRCCADKELITDLLVTLGKYCNYSPEKSAAKRG